MNNFNDLTPLEKLRVLKKLDSGDEETKNLIKLVELILHNELQTMLNEIRENIKAGIFMSESNVGLWIYKAEDVERVFEHKLIEVNGHEN